MVGVPSPRPAPLSYGLPLMRFHYMFSLPVWVRRWALRWEDFPYILEHPGCLHTWVFCRSEAEEGDEGVEVVEVEERCFLDALLLLLAGLTASVLMGVTAVEVAATGVLGDGGARAATVAVAASMGTGSCLMRLRSVRILAIIKRLELLGCCWSCTVGAGGG